MLTLIHPKADRLIDSQAFPHEETEALCPKKPQKTISFPLAQCQLNETEACPSRGSHAITHTQIQTYVTVLHLTSQTHPLMVLLIPIV